MTSTITPELYYEWRRWRLQQMLYILIAYSYSGLLHSIFFATEFPYIKDILNEEHPILMFGIGSGMQMISSVMSCIIGGIYYDFYRDIRGIVTVVNCSNLLGCAVYAFVPSIWAVIAGRFLFGVTAAGRNVIVAEIAHICEPSEVTPFISKAMTCYTIGTVLGTCLAFGFARVDTEWLGWRIHYGNMPAVVLLLCGTFLQILHFFTVRNLTLIYDLKSEYAENEMIHEEGNLYKSDKGIVDISEYDICILKEPTYRILSIRQYLDIFIKITTQRHFATLLSVAVLNLFATILVKRLLLVKASSLLNWSVQKLAGMRLVTMSCGMVTAGFTSHISKKVADIFLLIGNIFGLLALLTLTGCIPYVNNTHYSLSAYIFFCAGLLGVLDTLDHILLISMIANLVHSKFQGIADCALASFMYCGFAVSSFLLSVASKHMMIFCACVAVINALGAGALICEINFFIDRWKERYSKCKDVK